MSKKRMIIFTSVILSVVVISLGIVKLYQTYALGNYIDTASSAMFDVNITKDTSVRIPANGYSNVFYMVTNTSPGTVRYGVAYTTDSAVTVKTFSTSNDPASGLIEENGKKYVKLRLENSSSTSQSVVLSTVLGYSGDSNLLPPSGVTLVTEVYTPIPLAQYVTGLYTSGTKTTVTNNSITYNKVSSENLMNDRLGRTTGDLDGGNIRYYGANPNNYIYFNCSDYSNQTSSTCEVWRIIGVFDGKLKLIRGSQIGTLAWDQDKNDDSSKTTYDNDWSTATLQKLLNGSYYNGSGTITYYSDSTGTTSTSLDMTSIGIKNDETRNMIAEATYYLGGWNTSQIYPNEIYGYERGTTVYTDRPTTWPGKIALAYPSDYGYAVDFSQCINKQLSSYNDSTCTSNNWMESILGTSRWEWLLTHNSGRSYDAWYVLSGGYVNNDGSYNAFGVRPVLYLDAGVLLEMGNGTESNPYKISGGSSSNLEQPISTYTISYNANNGTGAPGDQIKTQNINLTLSDTIPTRSGYKFMGWNTNSDGSGTSYASGSSYTENESVTLYAQWKQIFTITYDANNGTGAPSSQTKIAGEAITLSNTIPTRSNYEFDGWNTNSDGSGASYAPGATYSSDSDVTLYAKWKQIYTISYNANGGSGVPSSQSKVYGTSITLSSTTPTKTGYTFTDWNTSSDGTGTSYAPGGSYSANENITLYAQWRINMVLIKLSTNGGVLSSGSGYFVSDDIVYNQGSNILSSASYDGTLISTGLPDYNNTSYLNITKPSSTASSGAEWKCLSGCTTSGKTFNQDTVYNASDFCDAASGDCTVTLGVNWVSSPTATFYPNEGKFSTGAESYSIPVVIGQNYYFSDLDLPAITKSNCTLDGWHMNSPGGTVYRSYFYLESGETNINFYANWSCSSGSGSTYTAKFYPNGGTFSTGVSSWSKTVNAGQTYYFSSIGIPSISKSNCSLDGWHDGSIYGTVYRSYFYLDSNNDFYANWSCSCSCQYVTKSQPYYSSSSANPCSSTSRVCNGTQAQYTNCTIEGEYVYYRQWHYVC